MSTAFSPNAQVILAALNVSGEKPKAPVKADYPDADAYTAALASYDVDLAAYDQSVKANARDIKVMLGEKSRISEQLQALDMAMDPENPGGKIFVGTVVKVSLEASSKRAIVTLHTGTDRTTDGVPQGCEQVRTDRTDNPDGRAIARTAQLLVGHRCTVFVELEAIRNGSTKVRVLRHLEDQGTDAKFNAATGQVDG